MKKSIMLIVSWTVAAGALFYTVLLLSFHWNFFNWSPKWDLETVAELLIALTICAAIWFLARASRDKASRIVSILVCLLLAGFALALCPAEATSAGWLGRTQPSPVWFRAGRLLLLCVPAIIWCWWLRRHLVQQR